MKKLLFTLILALLVSACSKDNPVSNSSEPDPNGTLIYSSPDSLIYNSQLLFDSLNLATYDSLIITYRFRTVSSSDTAREYGIVEYSGIYVQEYPMPFKNTFDYVDYRFAMKGKKKFNRLFIYVSPGNANSRIRDFKMYKK